MTWGRFRVALAASCVLAIPLPSQALCRVIEPAVDSGYMPVGFDPTTEILYVVVPDSLFGYRCPGSAELQSTPDCPDGSIGIEEKDTRIILVIQPRVIPRSGRGALVMAVPRGATIDRGSTELFNSLRSATRTWVHETITYVEDISLGVQCTDPHYGGGGGGYSGPSGLGCAVQTDGGTSMSALDAGWHADAGMPGGALDAGAIDGGLFDAGAIDGGRFDAGAIDGGLFDAGAIDAGMRLIDGGSWQPDIPTTPDQLPVIDDYAVETVASAAALRARFVELGLAPRSADLDAIGRYDGSHDFVLVVVEPDDRVWLQLAGLRPLVMSWRGSDLPFQRELLFDPEGATAFTQAYVAARARMELDDERAVDAYADVVSYPTDVAELAGERAGWLTRIDVVRDTREDVPDTLFVPASLQDPIDDTIERTRTVRIAAACCSGGSVPYPPPDRTFVETREYALGHAPSDDTLFYCAPPPPDEQCAADDGWPDAGTWTSRDDFTCGFDPPAPMRRRGCCGGCAVADASTLDLASAWSLVFAGALVAVRRARRRRR